MPCQKWSKLSHTQIITCNKYFTLDWPIIKWNLCHFQNVKQTDVLEMNDVWRGMSLVYLTMCVNVPSPTIWAITVGQHQVCILNLSSTLFFVWISSNGIFETPGKLSLLIKCGFKSYFLTKRNIHFGRKMFTCWLWYVSPSDLSAFYFTDFNSLLIDTDMKVQ